GAGPEGAVPGPLEGEGRRSTPEGASPRRSARNPPHTSPGEDNPYRVASYVSSSSQDATGRRPGDRVGRPGAAGQRRVGRVRVIRCRQGNPCPHYKQGQEDPDGEIRPAEGLPEGPGRYSNATKNTPSKWIRPGAGACPGNTCPLGCQAGKLTKAA